MDSIPAPTKLLSYQHFKRVLVLHSEPLFQLNDSCVVPTQGGLANHWGHLGAVLPNKAWIPGTVSGITVADHGIGAGRQQSTPPNRLGNFRATARHSFS